MAAFGHELPAQVSCMTTFGTKASVREATFLHDERTIVKSSHGSCLSESSRSPSSSRQCLFDDDVGGGFELGPPDSEDEQNVWDQILPTSEEHQYHAHHFMEDSAGMMQPDEDGPPEMHGQCYDGDSLENLPTVVEDGDDNVAAMWDPYTVEGCPEAPILVTTPKPKGNRKLKRK